MPYTFKAKLPNAANLGRSALLELDLANQGDRYSTMSGTKTGAFIGLDMTITNASGANATIELDGRPQVVPIGGLVLTNTYYDNIHLKSKPGTGGGLSFYLQGILLEVARELAGVQGVDNQ